MPITSDGPFSRVMFVLNRDFKWETFTYRDHRLAQSNSLVNLFHSFDKVLINTQLLKPK